MKLNPVSLKSCLEHLSPHQLEFVKFGPPLTTFKSALSSASLDVSDGICYSAFHGGKSMLCVVPYPVDRDSCVRNSSYVQLYIVRLFRRKRWDMLFSFPWWKVNVVRGSVPRRQG